MKKLFITLFTLILGVQQLVSCAWYDPEWSYYNLFAQSLIQNKAYLPFLLTYNSPFYEDDSITIPDENIIAWKEYFNNQLTLEETKDLVYNVSLQELNHLKRNRKLSNPILQKVGYQFYDKYREAIDYLIQAKYLEPYMRILPESDQNIFYYTEETKDKNVSELNYQKISKDLLSLYKSAKNIEIKQRYAYQMVRWQHYNRNYLAAIEAFDRYVTPLQSKSTVYYMALDQMAGAQRGLGLFKEANWNFFQVFKNTIRRKKSAYSSMRLNNENAFNDILNRAKTKEDRVLAYFLLAYQGFNNPLPTMKEIYKIDASSELLKVLQARAINEIERELLNSSMEYYPYERSKSNRLPLLGNENVNRQLNDLVLFTNDLRKVKKDIYWEITAAYLQFLKQDYKKSQKILANIKTNNPEFIDQIQRMKMLNEIVSKRKIDSKFENYIIEKYPNFIVVNQEIGTENRLQYGTKHFLQDILANRYFLQGEKAKSYLLSNQLSELKYFPDYELTKSIEAFYYKKNKSALEQKIHYSKLKEIEDPLSFFNLIYGDFYARNGELEKALKSYSLVKNGNGFIPQTKYVWNHELMKSEEISFPEDEYNYFDNIQVHIFGHNYWVSYTDEAEVTMEQEPFVEEFDFIKNRMNKKELMQVLIQLKEIGQGTGERASKANQLIANVFYNTSKLGFYRHVFVFDINNIDGGKFSFTSKDRSEYRYYYKNLNNQINDHKNFNEAMRYYEKSFQNTNDKERKARILFQMASVEQGNYYQWEAEQPYLSYTEENWQEKWEAKEKFFLQTKRKKFKNNFRELKKNYADTQTLEELRLTCSYLEYFITH